MPSNKLLVCAQEEASLDEEEEVVEEAVEITDVAHSTLPPEAPLFITPLHPSSAALATAFKRGACH